MPFLGKCPVKHLFQSLVAVFLICTLLAIYQLKNMQGSCVKCFPPTVEKVTRLKGLVSMSVRPYVLQMTNLAGSTAHAVCWGRKQCNTSVRGPLVPYFQALSGLGEMDVSVLGVTKKRADLKTQASEVKNRFW